jgi:hypothetical protein
MSLEMAHKVIVPQKKKIMSRSFLNIGTLIVNMSEIFCTVPSYHREMGGGRGEGCLTYNSNFVIYVAQSLSVTFVAGKCLFSGNFLCYYGAGLYLHVCMYRYSFMILYSVVHLVGTVPGTYHPILFFDIDGNLSIVIFCLPVDDYRSGYNIGRDHEHLDGRAAD